MSNRRRLRLAFRQPLPPLASLLPPPNGVGCCYPCPTVAGALAVGIISLMMLYLACRFCAARKPPPPQPPQPADGSISASKAGKQSHGIGRPALLHCQRTVVGITACRRSAHLAGACICPQPALNSTATPAAPPYRLQHSAYPPLRPWELIPAPHVPLCPVQGLHSHSCTRCRS